MTPQADHLSVTAVPTPTQTQVDQTKGMELATARAAAMVSMRMTCHHSPEDLHGGCIPTLVLLEDTYDWNAYHSSQQWQSYVGQKVEFNVVTVDSELAVQSITTTSALSEP